MPTLATGLVGCVILKPRTPKDVLRWLKECHNSFHSGSRTNILEVLEEIGRIEASWAVFRQANGITSRGCGRGENSYERQYFNYLQEKFLGRFKTWQLFDHGKVFVKGMDRLGLYSVWKNMMEQHTNFLDTRLETEMCVKVLRLVFITITANFERALSK
jgi:hypothetical protein